MAKTTGITWTDATFNPWIGCTKVSPACLHCYAETLDKNRFSKTMDGGTKDAPVSHWGPGAPRHRTEAATWKQVRKWNSRQFVECMKCGLRLEFKKDALCPGCTGNTWKSVPRRVFSASLADWLDHEVPTFWLADFLSLIKTTKNIDWQLLTKRPQFFQERLREVIGWTMDLELRDWLIDWRHGSKIPGNVWIGVTAENQTCYEQRAPDLLEIPARVRFLSMEPLLGPVQFGDASRRRDYIKVAGRNSLEGIHWVIAGGESGTGARPTHPGWVESIRDQCHHQRVPFLWKQWGDWSPGKSRDEYTEDKPLVCMKRSGELSWWAGNEDTTVNYSENYDPTDIPMELVGKKKAGRLIDGKLHHEFPTP